MRYVIGIALCLAGALTSARAEDVDPVVRAKAQRKLDDSHDLPPVPRGLTEPPPLPPPELHTHDIRRHRRSGSASAKRGKAAKKPAAQGKAQAPAKTAPRPQAAGTATASKGKAPGTGQPKGGATKPPQTPKKPAAGQPRKS